LGHRCLPCRLGDLQDGQADRHGDIQADRELETFGHDRVNEAVGRPGGIGPHQHGHAPLRVAGFGDHRQLGDRRVEQVHMISGGVRASTPGNVAASASLVSSKNTISGW
jgi:hypothetical protein